MKYSKEQLDHYRQLGDPKADKVVELLLQQPAIKDQIQSLSKNSALFSWQGHPLIGELIEDVIKNRSVSIAVKSGQDFFESHVISIMVLLGLYSLPYCYAAANGAKVLIHSKNIIENPGQRLGETAQFVLDVCRPDSFKEDSVGYVSILKVRLMHAAVRHHAARKIRSEVPINQEDMAGTNLSFSLLIIRGLQQVGQHLTAKEIADYLRLWNFIGERMGVDSGLLPNTYREYYLLEKSIRKHQFKQSEEGDRLIQALLDYFNRMPVSIPGFDASVAIAAFVGNDVAKCLNIERPQVAQSAMLTLLRTSHFFVSFLQDHFLWILESISDKTQSNDTKDHFIIPI